MPLLVSQHISTSLLTAEQMGKIPLTPLRIFPRCCSLGFCWVGLLESLTKRDSHGCFTGTYTLFCFHAGCNLHIERCQTLTFASMQSFCVAVTRACRRVPFPSQGLESPAHSSHHVLMLFLICRRQIYWILIFIGTPPVYSAISRIPALQHSLADVSRWGAGMYILIIIGESANFLRAHMHSAVVA